MSVNDGKVACKEITELNSNHEEADTKLLLHAKHGSENGETTIIIKSLDTDVAILACHFCSDISAWILIMKKEKTRNIYLETSAIADAAGPLLCDALVVCMLSPAATQLARLQSSPFCSVLIGDIIKGVMLCL